MVSNKERFWITLMLRVAFGFLFLFVALGQFDAGGPRDSGPKALASLKEPSPCSSSSAVSPLSLLPFRSPS